MRLVSADAEVQFIIIHESVGGIAITFAVMDVWGE